MNQSQEREGIIFAALSYFIWGIVPLYWKWLDHVGAEEILAHRVIWSFVFMVIILLCTKKWSHFVIYFKEILKNQKKLFALTVASVLVSMNWGIFIWAINADRILDTSLGYYINPLISVLLGVIILKEKLSRPQVISVILAAIGVIILTIHFGKFPIVSFFLAITFGLYGLAKKMINADASIGLTMETLMVTPIAIGYFLFITFQGKSMFASSMDTALLLIGGGVATALPLLFFAKGAQKVSLSMLGFLQYIAPTLTLLIGVFIYHEEFTKTHLVSFIFIWAGLIIYSLSKTKFRIPTDQKWKRKHNIGA
ncbi:EamA family transporter RarD [Peribacillus alkalitolerans]|uniref:EamA family transporter RarD n=1 Tax=Peribacillus alkalitolerans TaxID=1550385 RepID=UPI0013D774A4|nr:EamA family transporter RarD [Peribacillus alkalitolerans]